jgi:flagellar biosynthesis protein FlhG
VKRARVISVASGKGGVGKTSLAVNLAVALAGLGRRTMLVDCDVGCANADILLGLKSDLSIADIAWRGRRIGEVARTGPSGMALVAGHSGAGLGGSLALEARTALAAAFRPCAEEWDDIVVDTGAGLADGNLDLVAASDMVLLVLAGEPAAFMDAYALVKALSQQQGCAAFHVVTNRVSSEADGQALFARFERVVEQFLPVHLEHLGAIPEDRYLRDAVFVRRCCVEAFPSAPASGAFARLARRLAARDVPMLPGGHAFFGLEAVHGPH